VFQIEMDKKMLAMVNNIKTKLKKGGTLAPP